MKNSQNANNIFNVSSEFILEKIFDNLIEIRLLKVIRYNNKLKNILNKDNNDYKKYSNIVIEVIPYMHFQNGTKGFIDIDCDKNYCHVYFNDDSEEIKRNYFTSEDKVQKIKIVLDYRIQSLNGIFRLWKSIKKVNFINFKRNNITHLNYLFKESSVEEINFYDFPGKSVTNMKGLFSDCQRLRTINFYAFDTSNVTDMSYMFNKCLSIENLNFSKFDTSKVTDMSFMFNYCSSLKY